MKYLYPKQILYLHQQIAALSGGDAGLRDEGLLESAVYRPQASFGGQEFYPDVFHKASAMGHSIIRNHPFIDGNKRTGFETMRLFLRINGYDVRAAEEKKFKFAMGIAEGNLTEMAIAEWLKKHSRPYRKSR